MKVERSMIAPDLRLAGSVYRKLKHRPSGHVHPRKAAPRENPPRRRVRDGRRTCSEYVQRKDGSWMRLLVCRPKVADAPSPCALWIHGGGYVVGMPEMLWMSQARTLAETCLVASPSYTLATRSPWPAALDDCALALAWLAENAERLGARTDQIFVGGESAGGGLAAALCLLMRDTDGVRIAGQMPLYPMLDDRMLTESMRDNDAPVWDARQNAAAWSMYLKGLDEVSKYAAPARETDYTGLPPAISFVGSVEPFRDEAIQYMRSLEEAGVEVVFRVFDGCFHAFDMMAPRSAEAREATAFFSEAVSHAERCWWARQDG